MLTTNSETATNRVFLREEREEEQVDAGLSCIERWRLVAKLPRLIYHKYVKLYSTISTISKDLA